MSADPAHNARLSVAPMMDWTDRHCRYFHRQLSRHALLYTEMVTSAALIRGRAGHLLDHDAAEHPVALQLGGADPAELAQAARLVAEAGFVEINLNVGCPSDRVQSGRFGAVLMKEPGLVGDCVAAMAAAQPLDVTVKCRIGVDDQEPRDILPAFIETVKEAGATRVIVHARKAWLEGLSPKENRDIPPLDYPLVAEMNRTFTDLPIHLNGGVETLEDVTAQLEAGFAGVMVGRAAYHRPADLLCLADRVVFGAETPDPDPVEVVAAMEPYIARHLESGGKLSQVTRHMLGLFTGRPGARAWRRILSEEGAGPHAGLDVLTRACAAVTDLRPAA